MFPPIFYVTIHHEIRVRINQDHRTIIISGIYPFNSVQPVIDPHLNAIGEFLCAGTNLKQSKNK